MVVLRVHGVDLVAVYFPQGLRKVKMFDWLLSQSQQWLSCPALLVGGFNTGKHRLDEDGTTFVASHQHLGLASLRPPVFDIIHIMRLMAISWPLHS